MSMQPETTTKKGSCFRRFFGMFKDSALEFKSTRNLVICAMMAALAIVLSSTSIYITDTIKIGCSGLPNRLVDFMFGPVVGCIFGGLMDIIKFFIKPDGAFFPGYTLTAMLGGLIYGIFYYRLQIKKPKFADKQEGEADRLAFWITSNIKAILLIFIANVLVKFICNIGLNTLWSSMFTGKAWIALLPTRVVKNLIQIPLDTVVHFALIKLFCQLKRYLFPDNTK